MPGLNYDFVFPKVHGIWADSFSVERINHLAASQDLNALSRALTSIGIDIADRREVQKSLFSRLIEDLHQIQRLLEDSVAAFYGIQVQRFFFENLKVILHYRYQRNDVSDLDRMLVAGPGLTALDVEQLMEAKTIHQFYQRLPKHPCKEKMLPILVELDDSRDMLVAESQVDRIFYEWLWDSVNRLPRNIHKTAAQLTNMEVDILNIITCLRNAAIYKIEGGRLRELLLDTGGAIEATCLNSLAAADTEEAITRLAPPAYRKVLSAYSDAPLYVRENALWTLVYDRSYKHFRDFNRPAESVIAFPFLKRFEYLNLSRLFEGLYLELHPQTIRRMVIGGVHV